MSLTLRAARPDEAGALTELCMRSKAVWGYDAAFMAACRDELTITSAMMARTILRIAESEGRMIGMVQLDLAGAVAVLDKLYVDPAALRSGAGRALLQWAMTAAREAGAGTMAIDADPGAAAFYRRMGAVDDGEAPSGSIPGRMLPRLVLPL
ncbi:GNAT family N-acetyltransferase [Tardiphaga sp.]|uniref:GNAT family N-acetyltransferase n=1 Tax=Tardiphaga sp. TaxID=1926292 RepID=UPI0037DA368E